MMTSLKTKDISGNRRNLYQNASHSIRDVYDAIVELVTNADDRYQLLDSQGRLEGVGVIEIDVERRRKQNKILKVRDFADGMTGAVMDQKLSNVGGRVSGMELGLSVRGTNSRGAKDVAALGEVSFKSFAEDGQFHECQITRSMRFLGPESSIVTGTIRREGGIRSGTGTLVTIVLHEGSSVLPHHARLLEGIRHLVQLRWILSDPRRRIVLRDIVRGREDVVGPLATEGKECLSQSFHVPGYPATAKMKVFRSSRPLDRDKDRFRKGGILVRSRHAVHQATLFDSALESDPHAAWFYGWLRCEYIDELWNDFDERFESGEPLDPANSRILVDPNRRVGLLRDHPFTKALFAEAVKRLRPLVEEERRRADGARTEVESRETRKRLDALQKAAAEFMSSEEEPETSRDPNDEQPNSRFRNQGFSLNPAYAKIVQGHSQNYWFNISQEVFPEIEVGSTVQIECLSPEITCPGVVSLEPHPKRDSALRAIFKVHGRVPSKASGLKVRVGSIVAEATLEVIASERDLYADVKDLDFQHQQYRVRAESGRKKIRVIAPITLAPERTSIDVATDGPIVLISGETTLVPRPELGVAIAEFWIKVGQAKEGTSEQLTVTLGSRQATAKVIVIPETGAGLSIKIRDIDLKNQRYQWRSNVLEVAAKHPSLSRYLGDANQDFPGQEDLHFRVLVAEIVSDAVCGEMLRKRVDANPIDWECADWDTYYAEFSQLMTLFLPVAHKIQVPERRV